MEQFFVPDTIFLFGEYWIDRYNIKSEKKIIGNPSFEYHLKKLNRIKQNLNQVLCISVNSVNFGKTIFQASEKNKNINYLFKLRDSEYNDWKKITHFLPTQTISKLLIIMINLYIP